MIYNNLIDFGEIIGNKGVLISIDYGAKKLGISISSENRSMALPLAVIPNDKNIFSKICDFLITKKSVGVILGHPVNMDGTISDSCKKVEEFANHLSKKIDIPIYLQDERRTSRAADSLLKIAGYNRKERNQIDDSIAATLILESTLSQLKLLSE